MIVFLLIFLIIILYKVKIVGNGYNSEYLSKENTNAIKGFFIIVVFINHIQGYYELANAHLVAWYDATLFLPAKVFGQLMVVMFLFYSGYGVAESIKKKKDTYIKLIPKRRVLGTLINFDIAVIVFAITCLLLGIKIGIVQFLLSILGWSSVGNSNWYIFCIVTCYMLTYISYNVSRERWCIVLCFFIIGYAVIMSFYKGTWWYNTVFAYGAGVLFSEHRKWLVYRWKQHYYKWLILCLIGFTICLVFYLIFYRQFKSTMEATGAMIFNAMSIFFAYIVVIITMKVSVHNKALVWMGTNLFPLYIYQRLPMMILTTQFPTVLVANHPYIFLTLCLVITGCIAWGYHFIQIKV